MIALDGQNENCVGDYSTALTLSMIRSKTWTHLLTVSAMLRLIPVFSLVTQE